MNTDQIITNSPTLPENTVSGYRLRRDLHDKVQDFLNTRPYTETEQILTEMFEDHPYENLYWTLEGVQVLMDYLKSLPRKEVKDLMADLAVENSLNTWSIPAPIQNVSDVPNQKVNGQNVSDIPAEPKGNLLLP